MGTPDICLPSLDYLRNNQELCAIITGEDKSRGRGNKLTPTPVATWAEEHKIKTYKTKNYKEILDIERPDIIIVLAYGKILPKEVLDYCKYGCINLHGSLLPKYRGAAPIQQAIINGDKITGMTAQKMAEALDTGDILLQKELAIKHDDTSGSLFNKMAILAKETLEELLNNIDNIMPIKQDESKATYAKMLTKENSFIDTNKTCDEVINFIRGYNPNPVARYSYKGEILKVYEAIKSDVGLAIKCSDGYIRLTKVQPPNKKIMQDTEYLNGRKK